MLGPLLKWPLLEGGDPRAPSISQALGLAQAVSSAGSTFNRSFSDFLDLLDVGRRPTRAVVISQLGPSSFCAGPMLIQGGYASVPCTIPQGNVPPVRWVSSVSLAMTLLDSIFAGKEKDASVSHVLSLVDSFILARQADVSSTLSLTQTIAADLLKTVAHVLAMTQALGVQNTANRSFTDALALLNTIASQATHTVSLADALLLQQLISQIREFQFSDALVLVQTIQRIQPASVSQALVLVEQFLADQRKPTTHVLAMTSTVGCQKTSNRQFTDGLGLKQGVIAWKAGSLSSCDASYLATVDLELVKNVTFTYPFDGSNTTLVVRAPKFGNVDSTDLGTVVRRNRGGDFKVVRPPSWPSVEVLKMTFSALTQSKSDAFVAFLEVAAGREIGFLDQESIQWRGVILTPLATVVQALRVCAFEISLEFRGSRA